ncbi:phage portal protein [Thermopirellula anaerolimosa]
MTTEDNRRHWAAADGLSARAANSPEVRRILRNRARYEVANNSYARGIVLTLANDCVGTGPRLQMLTPNAEANRRIEQEFSMWAKAVGLAEKLRTMRMARAQDGEAFAILTSNPRLPTQVKLDLRLVEADQVTTPDPSALGGNAVDGIVFDSSGNPVEYHVLREHPGDAMLALGLQYDRVPAEAIGGVGSEQEGHNLLHHIVPKVQPLCETLGVRLEFAREYLNSGVLVFSPHLHHHVFEAARFVWAVTPDHSSWEIGDQGPISLACRWTETPLCLLPHEYNRCGARLWDRWTPHMDAYIWHFCGRKHWSQMADTDWRRST